MKLREIDGGILAERRSDPSMNKPSLNRLEFICAGEPLEALPMGALYWPAERLLAVADLHLEKGSSYAVNARKLLPRATTRARHWGRLRRLIDAVQPRTVVCLGDSFHDRDCYRAHARRRALGDRAADLTHALRLDRGQSRSRAAARWTGARSQKRSRPARWCFVTRPASARQDGEVSGHYHPVAALTVRGRGLRRRCFLTDGQRLILPAFGAYAGGPQRARPGDRATLPRRLRRARRREGRSAPPLVAPASPGNALFFTRRLV